MKFNINLAKLEFEKEGCFLLEEVYINSNQPMRYVCKCGRKSKISLSNFKSGNRCKHCGILKRSNSRRLNIECVRSEFEKAGFVLLEDHYINNSQLLLCICKCGREAKISFTSLKRGSQCKKCGVDKRGDAQRFNIEYARSEFEKVGCVLLENEYVSARIPMNYICQCGRKSKIRLYELKSGQRCKFCGVEKNSAELHYKWNLDRNYIKTRKIISHRCATLLRRCLKLLHGNKTTKTETLLGYSRKDLFNHIVSHPNWGNVKNQNWHIDHIFPVKAFLEHGITDLKIINALDNLQPLLSTANASKGDNYNKKTFFAYLVNKL